MISSISRLADLHGCDTLQELGRHFYNETECGVTVEYLTLKDSVFSHDEHYGVTRTLPNIWAGHYVTGIRFHTIVEGSEAEFSADAIYFPCEQSEIDDALKYLEELADEEFQAVNS